MLGRQQFPATFVRSLTRSEIYMVNRNIHSIHMPNIFSVCETFSTVNLTLNCVGTYIVKAVEIEAKFLDKQERGVGGMRGFEIGINRLSYPEIGETITVTGPRGENALESLWVTSPSVYFDIDWSELYTASEDHEGFKEDQPDTFECNYFKDGRICSDEWWCWSPREDETEPFPSEVIEVWALGKRQSLTINRAGELVWRCTILQALEENHTYPPAIEMSWTCKAKKACAREA